MTTREKLNTAQLEMITREKCTCGHTRLFHADTVGGLAVGHGHCCVKSCECSKFTWTNR